jgi:hypothetical protein
VALFRAHDTGIAGRQLFKTGETEALTETFFGFPVTVYAPDDTLEIQPQRMAHKIIQRHPGFAEKQAVVHRAIGLGRHLSEPAGHINHCGQDFTSKY